MQLTLDPRQLAEHRASRIEQASPGGGELELTPNTGKEYDPEAPLELGQLMTHGRLRQMEARGRACGTALLRDGANEAEVPNFEH